PKARAQRSGEPKGSMTKLLSTNSPRQDSHYSHRGLEAGGRGDVNYNHAVMNPAIGSSAANRLAAGVRLGPYEILAPLGAGGMGEVYRGRDTRLDRSVAIKVLPAHLSQDEERRRRFQREARLISNLSHANICTLFDVGSQDNIDFLVMELLEGESLSHRLDRKS